MTPPKLRHGFKTEANRLARAVRKDLGLDAEAPLDPWKLGDFLGVEIFPLSSLSELPAEIEHFMQVEPSALSAVTVFRGRKRAIVHNDGHLAGRQANNIAHELAHALLMHEPAPALTILGCRKWDPVVEDEANWLGPALLVSDEAALHIVKEQMTHKQAAALYGVSEEVIRMRLNVTGARRRALRPAVAKSVERDATKSRGRGAQT